MAYILNLTNGNVLAVVDDGTVNTSACDLVLIGRNVTTYGERQNENFIRLLENFANTQAPSTPLPGQLWYDSGTSQLKLRVGGNWQGLGLLTKSSTPPPGPSDGDLWYDTSVGQLFARQDTVWRVVGPISPKSLTDSYLQVETISGTDVLSVWFAGTRLAVFSNTTVTSGPAGFSNIAPGINLSSSVAGARFAGTASNADLLNSISSSQFMRSDQNTGTSGTLDVGTSAGQLNVGSAQEAAVLVDTVSAAITRTSSTVLRNNVIGRAAALRVRTGTSSYVDLLIADAETGTVYIAGDLQVSGNLVATSASRLSNARDIALAGAVLGSAAFDGTANISISTSLAQDRVRVAGDTVTGELIAAGGFAAGTGIAANLLVVANAGVGINTTDPQLALDVAGAVRSVPVTAAATSGSITLSGLHNNHVINLTGPATVDLVNFSLAGQIMRVVITATNQGVSWSGPIAWPNGVEPVLTTGPVKAAVVTLVRVNSQLILGTYVSY